MTMQCITDDALAPLFVYRVIGRPTDVGKLQEMLLDQVERRYDQYPSLAEIYDFRELQLPPHEVREYMTAWISVNRARIARSSVATATVLRSLPIRWMLSAWWAIQPPPAQRYKTFARLIDAVLWAVRALAQASVIIEPVRVKSYLRSLEIPLRTNESA